MRNVVYVIRPGDDNLELRYSLRSLVNVPHADVWIVGSVPSWVRNVRTLALCPKAEKWANLRQSLTALCACAEISQEFLLFNDDMYVTRSVSTVPVFHLGSVSGYVERERAEGRTEGNSWFRGLLATWDQMRDWGHDDPLCYETHQPMPYRRDELGALLDAAECEPFLWNTAYAATSGPVGRRGENHKVSRRDDLTVKLKAIGRSPFLSSSKDIPFATSPVGRHVQAMFWEPSGYEERG